jgi:hypothetical protein
MLADLDVPRGVAVICSYPIMNREVVVIVGFAVGTVEVHGPCRKYPAAQRVNNNLP